MRKSIATIATVTAMFTLAACSDTSTDDPSPEATSPASSEPETTEPTSEPTDTGEPTEDPAETGDGSGEGGQTTRVGSEGGRYAFDLPKDYTVESDVIYTDSDYWQNNEPSASYTIYDSNGVEIGSMGVNIETSSDGIPADYVEVVEVLPTHALDNGQVYARTTLSSLCWGETETPEEDCNFVYSMDVVSGAEGDDPEVALGNPEALWMMAEDPNDTAQGVVLFNVTVGGPEGFPFAEKDAVAQSEDYAKAWNIVESFGMNG